MTLFYIDPSISGISGDMVLSALASLGGDIERFKILVEEIERNTGHDIDLKIEKVRKKGISALQVQVISEGRCKNLTAVLEDLPLNREERKFALNVANTILKAEAEVHGTVPEEVHLHELGNIDTVVDIAGTASLAGSLGLFDEKVEVYSSPVLVGRGKTKTEQGLLPVPPPVVAEILKEYRIPFTFSEEEGELATPTGTALLAHMATKFEKPPTMTIESIGIGAGTLDLKVPNILRIIKGHSTSTLHQEEITVLETSVDDVTGEVLGYIFERLYDSGALDVQIIPTITKKNRPGYIVQVVCKEEKAGELADLLMRETGTLGVRTGRFHKRFYLSREVKTAEVRISTYKGKVRVKISRDSRGNIISLKPEYEDAKKIAQKTNLPLKAVIREIENQTRDELKE
jgi:hypothetical protein